MDIYLKHLIKLILLSLQLVSISIASANIISGTISLPSGIVAPADGVSFTVESFGFDPEGAVSVFIPSGQDSVSYTLEFSIDDYQFVNFECNSGCDTLDITTTGGWDNTRGVVGWYDGQRFAGTQDHVVDILLELADSFTGTVEFPDGAVANDIFYFIVAITSADSFSSDSRYTAIELLSPGQQSSFNFKIGVPTDETSTAWRVSFGCILECASVTQTGQHYATSAFGGDSSIDPSVAFEFPKGQDYSDLRLNLIDTSPIPIDFTLAPILMLLEDDE